MSKIGLAKSIKASELCAVLGLELIGEDQKIFSVGAVSTIDSGVLAFSKTSLEELSSGVLIAHKEQAAKTLMVSERPRYDFCRALNYFLDAKYYSNESLAAASIDATAKIAATAIIERGVSIGANCEIGHNVVIRSGTRVATGCVIRENSVIGAEGFGFEQGPDGRWLRFPHLGGVRLYENVEIGALNSVCKGALSDTIIHEGVKTDNLVHIAHNCVVGRDSIITACAEFSGGVELGERVWIGPNSSLMEKIKIGDNTLIGLGSVVRKSLPANVVAAGSPAKILRSK